MRNLFYLSIMLFIVASLVSCNNKEKKAKENIKTYLIENSRNGTKITFNQFSKLYILSPKDNSKIPSPDITASEKESAYDFGNLFSIYSSGLALSLGGCTPKILQRIIDNDKKFNEWNTGGDEFIMICFFTGKDKFLEEYDLGVCIRLDSMLNVSKLYRIKNNAEIKRMIE